MLWSLILFFFLRLPSLFEPYWYGDEGIYLALGQGIRSGLTLYSQIHDNKPPTLYYLAALSQTVLGFRLLLLLWMIPTIYFFYRLALKFLAKKPAKLATLLFLILTSVPLFEGNIANAEIFMLLPTIAAVYLLLSKPLVSCFLFLVSGFLLGFAFTIKVPVAIEFALFFLWIFVFFKDKFLVKLKNLFLFTLGFFLPIFLYLIYFWRQGALQPFLVSSLLQNFGYLSSWSTGTHQASATSGGLVTRGVIMLLFWLFAYILYRRQKISRQFLFLFAWFFAALMGVLLPGRPYPHYLIQILPPLCLLIFYFSKYRLPSLLAVSVLIYSLFHFKFYFYPVFSYYQNFYSYALHFKSRHDYYRFFGDQVPDFYQIADRIRTLSTPQETLFIWGDAAYLYPLSQRLPATKYLVAYHIVDFQGHDLTISQLKAQTPAIILYYPQPSRPFPQLDNFINHYYHLVDQIGTASIYRYNQSP